MSWNAHLENVGWIELLLLLSPFIVSALAAWFAATICRTFFEKRDFAEVAALLTFVIVLPISIVVTANIMAY